MPSDEREALPAYIEELRAATKAGKIGWKSVNPTTFLWEITQPKHARVTLQRIERVVNVQTPPAAPGRPPVVQQRKDVFYVFQVFDLTQPQLPILAVETSNDPQQNEKFDALFEVVKSSMSEKTFQFLKSILPQ